MAVIFECDYCGSIIEQDDNLSGWGRLQLQQFTDMQPKVYQLCPVCIPSFHEWMASGREVAIWLQGPDIEEPSHLLETPQQTFDRMADQHDRVRWEREREYKRKRGINPDGKDRTS
jgi:hypothetical protein